MTIIRRSQPPGLHKASDSHFRRGLLALAAAFVLHSLAIAKPADDDKLAKPRDDLPGLKNFAVVSDALWRGAQPTAEGFAELKRRGAKTIIDLRAEHSDRDKLAGTGLKYVEIPCRAWNADPENGLKFLKVVLDKDNQPVFVHCEHGSDRTGMMVAVYRMVEQGWSSDDAVKELPNFHFHPIFGNVVLFLKKFDPAATRKKLEQTAAPKIEVIK